MRIVDRDLELLKWINGFGFTTGSQISKKMKVCERVANRRLEKLEAIGVLERQRIFWRGGAVVRLTNEGVRMCGDEIGCLKQIRMGTFEHDKQVVDLSLAMEGYDDFEHFVPERRIRHELGMKGVGQSGHVPDGHVLNAAGERIAIELELTKKQQHRLKRIIRGLSNVRSYGSKW